MSIGSKNKIEILPEIQGAALKAGREKLRLDIQDLATKACLSKKHITELEQGGVSSFYSESHKITVAKKVAKILQLDESQVLVHPDGDVAQQESLPFDTAVEDLQQPVKVQEIKAVQEERISTPDAKQLVEDTNQPKAKSVPSQATKVSLENLQSGGEIDNSRPQQKGSRRGLVSVLLLILIAGGLYSSKNEIMALFSPPAVQPQAVVVEDANPQESKDEGANSANPANPSAPSGLAPNSAVPVAPAASNVAAVAPLPSDVSCPKPDASITEQSVSDPTKPGNFVHVYVESRQIVCVVDATGKSMMQSIEAGTSVGAGHTFSGKAPFTILTNGLSQTAVFFQGKRIRPSNEQARTMRVKEAPTN